jgi:hypothetical protein
MNNAPHPRNCANEEKWKLLRDEHIVRIQKLNELRMEMRSLEEHCASFIK